MLAKAVLIVGDDPFGRLAGDEPFDDDRPMLAGDVGTADLEKEQWRLARVAIFADPVTA